LLPSAFSHEWVLQNTCMHFMHSSV